MEVKGVKEWKVEKILIIKNKGSCKVLGIMGKVYSRVWYIGKREEFGKCNKNSSKIGGKAQYKSKKIRKDKFNKRTRL